MVNKKERSPTVVSVACPCGRELRAKFNQVGTEICCWDCHQMVSVPEPGLNQKVARELSGGALVVIKGPGLISLIAASAITTAILAVPIAGTWCSVIALTLAASVYGEIIHRVSRGASGEPNPPWKSTLIPRSASKWILCALMALGTVCPLWIMNASVKQSPHLNWLGGLILAAMWIIWPMLMLANYGCDGDQPLGLKGCGKRLARHPLASFLAITVVPAVVVLLEVTLGLILYSVGSLPFFALDFMPMPRIPDAPVMIKDIPYYDSVDYRTHPESKFVDGYFRGLRCGYSFVGAIPASLAKQTHAGINTDVHGYTPLAYFVIRTLIVLALLILILMAFAIQARWLGAIPALDRRVPL